MTFFDLFTFAEKIKQNCLINRSDIFPNIELHRNAGTPHIFWKKDSPNDHPMQEAPRNAATMTDLTRKEEIEILRRRKSFTSNT